MQTLKIRLSDSLLASIREVLCLRSVSIEHYFVELAEVDTAPIRLQKLRSNFLLPSGVKAKTIEKTDDDIWRTKVRPEQVQRILFLAESEKMSPPEIAASMANVSRSTVRRVLSQRAQAPNRTPVPRGYFSSSRTTRGASHA